MMIIEDREKQCQGSSPLLSRLNESDLLCVISALPASWRWAFEFFSEADQVLARDLSRLSAALSCGITLKSARIAAEKWEDQPG